MQQGVAGWTWLWISEALLTLCISRTSVLSSMPLPTISLSMSLWYSFCRRPHMTRVRVRPPQSSTASAWLVCVLPGSVSDWHFSPAAAPVFPPDPGQISPAPSLPVPGLSCIPSAKRRRRNRRVNDSTLHSMFKPVCYCVTVSPRSAGWWHDVLSSIQGSDPSPPKLSPSSVPHSPSDTPSVCERESQVSDPAEVKL